MRMGDGKMRSGRWDRGVEGVGDSDEHPRACVFAFGWAVWCGDTGSDEMLVGRRRSVADRRPFRFWPSAAAGGKGDGERIDEEDFFSVRHDSAEFERAADASCSSQQTRFFKNAFYPRSSCTIELGLPWQGKEGPGRGTVCRARQGRGPRGASWHSLSEPRHCSAAFF